MKILFVCQNSPFKEGGVETRTREMARKAVREGHRVTVLCPKTAAMDPDISEIEGIRVLSKSYLPAWLLRRYPYPHRFPLAVSKLFLGFSILALLRRERFDLIREDVAPVPCSGFLSFFRIPGIPKLGVVHNRPGELKMWCRMYGTVYGILGNLFEKCLHLGLLKYDRLVTPILSYAEDLRGFPALSSKVVAIPNGTHFSSSGKSKRARRQGGPWRMLAVGRMVRLKGFDKLIEAMAIVQTRHPGIRMTLVGEGPETARLISLAERLGVRSAVDFHPAVSHEAVLEMYGQFDLFLTASESEGFSIVVLEAMASGVPLLVSDIAGMRDVVDRQCATFFDPKDLGDLVDKWCWCLGHPEEIEEKAEEAFRRIRRLGWEDIYREESSHWIALAGYSAT